MLRLALLIDIQATRKCVQQFCTISKAKDWPATFGSTAIFGRRWTAKNGNGSSI